MDTITHLALGAVIGEAVAGREIGKRAMMLGAAAQVLPDIDFIGAFWLSPAQNLIAHRGLTHSLFFGILSVLLLTYLAAKYYRNKLTVTSSAWLLFFTVQSAVHLFIDSFNAYGIGLFQPFTNIRVSFHALYVADPLFTIWPVVAVVVLLAAKKMKSPTRRRWALFSLMISIAYLLIAVANKMMINNHVQVAMKERKLENRDFITTPTPFNSLLWYVLVKTDNGYYAGYRSVFDKTTAIPFHLIQQHREVTDSIELPAINEGLIQLSQGYYSYTIHNDTLSMNLLPFGQVAGWKNPDAGFIVECNLIPAETRFTLLQEGRSAEMNRDAMEAMMYRIFSEANR